MRHPLKPFYNWLYAFRPPEMVSWWKRQSAVQAKATEAKDGSYMMWMQGEKYPFPGFPRGHLLFGSLSPLKHQIKNQVFNEAWAMLEAEKPRTEVISHIKGVLKGNILDLGKDAKMDMLPIEKQVPAVREIHRAWTATSTSKELNEFRDIVCFILNEDDGYRFRFQWLAEWFPLWMKRNPLKYFEKALNMLEHAETLGDMKERIKLLRRITLLLLEDKGTREWFTRFAKEINWKKVKLSKADKFYFRAKYFKVDFRKYDY